MKLSLAIAALALLACVSDAVAQSSEVSITGKLFPGACKVNLGDGGIIDLGEIHVRDLSATEITELPTEWIPINVACESPARYALQGLDNTNGSSMTAGRYGLGMTRTDQKIGDVRLALRSQFFDSVPVYGTYSSDNGASWSVSGSEPDNWISIDGLLGFAIEPSVTTGPSAFMAALGLLEVYPRIRPTRELTIDEAVEIRGSITVNVIYL